jgi:hypothetical protein
LGVAKAGFLLSGPTCGQNEDIGGEYAAYKTEAAARRDWKAHRSELMQMVTDPCRRPWAYWEYDLDLDAPSGGDQAKVILELGLYRNAAEKELLEARVAHAQWDRQMEAERLRLGYRKTS